MPIDNLDNTDARYKLNKVYTDVLIGGGRDNPSVITRLALIEDSIARTNNNLNKLVYLVIGTILTVIGEIVVKVLFK